MTSQTRKKKMLEKEKAIIKMQDLLGSRYPYLFSSLSLFVVYLSFRLGFSFLSYLCFFLLFTVCLNHLSFYLSLLFSFCVFSGFFSFWRFPKRINNNNNTHSDNYINNTWCAWKWKSITKEKPCWTEKHVTEALKSLKSLPVDSLLLSHTNRLSTSLIYSKSVDSKCILGSRIFLSSWYVDFFFIVQSNPNLKTSFFCTSRHPPLTKSQANPGKTLWGWCSFIQSLKFDYMREMTVKIKHMLSVTHSRESSQALQNLSIAIFERNGVIHEENKINGTVCVTYHSLHSCFVIIRTE